jgi:hypothetical protein
LSSDVGDAGGIDHTGIHFANHALKESTITSARLRSMSRKHDARALQNGCRWSLSPFGCAGARQRGDCPPDGVRRGRHPRDPRDKASYEPTAATKDPRLRRGRRRRRPRPQPTTGFGIRRARIHRQRRRRSDQSHQVRQRRNQRSTRRDRRRRRTNRNRRRRSLDFVGSGKCGESGKVRT